MVPDSVLFCIVFTRVWGFQTVVLSPLTNLVHTCCLNLKDRHCTAVRLCSAFSNTVSWVLYVHFFFYSILALSGVTVLVLFSWARWSSFSNLEVSLRKRGPQDCFFFSFVFLTGPAQWGRPGPSNFMTDSPCTAMSAHRSRTDQSMKYDCWGGGISPAPVFSGGRQSGNDLNSHRLGFYNKHTFSCVDLINICGFIWQKNDTLEWNSFKVYKFLI